VLLILSTPGLSYAGWLGGGWIQRRAFTVSNTSNSNAQTNYAVRLDLNSDNFNFSLTKSDGSDIRVTDSTGTNIISHYIQSYSSGSSTGTIWVNVPSIPASSTATVYLYYGNPSPPNYSIPPIGNFAKYASNPVYSTGSATPSGVIYDGSTYYWMALQNATNSRIDFLYSSSPTGPWTLSSNHFTPASFAQGGVCLRKFGSTYYLYYQNNPNATSSTINVVSSTTAPDNGYGSATTLISCGTGWESQFVGEPYVIQVAGTYGSVSPNTYVLFYEGDSSATLSNEQVGYATSSSPTGPFTKYGSNPLISYGGTNAYDAGMVSDPHAFELNGTLYIFYNCTLTSPSTTPGYTAWVSTTNLTTLTKGNVVLGFGNTGAWDAAVAFRGGISLFNNTYYFYYGGAASSGSNFQIGYATMSALNSASGYPPDQVFGFYEDFNGGDLSHTIFIQNSGGTGGTHATGAITESSGIGTLTSGYGTTAYNATTLNSIQQFGAGTIFEAYVKDSNASTGNGNLLAFSGIQSFDETRSLELTDDSQASSGKFGYSTAGSSSTYAALSPAVNQDDANYHYHRVYWKTASSVDFQIDSNSVTNLATAADIPTGTMNALLQSYAAQSQTTSMSTLVDYMFARPYSSPEPQTVSTITYQANSSATGTTSASVSAPSGAANGDVMLVFKADKATSGNTSAASGFTNANLSSYGTSGRLEVFYGIYNSSTNPGPWSFTGTTHTQVLMVTYRNCDQTTPLDVSASAAYNASGTVGAASITPITAGSMIVGAFASLTSNYTWSAESIANGPSLTAEIQTNNSTYTDIAVLNGLQLFPGATGASTGTMSTAGANAAAIVALRPASLLASVAYNTSSSGGAVTGGSSSYQFSRVYSMSKGAVSGGTFAKTANHTYTVSSAGGAVVGGSVQEHQGLVYSTAGGGIAGGSSTEAVNHQYLVSMNGGGVAGGSSGESTHTAGGAHQYTTSSSGGVVAGGTFVKKAGVVLSMQSGAVAGGSSIYSPYYTNPTSYVTQMQGGPVAGGTAYYDRAAVLSSAGGGVVGGTSPHRFGFVIASASGGVAGGTALFNERRAYTSIGGAVAGGSFPKIAGPKAVRHGGAALMIAQ
jgi:hypothetical protein